MAGNWEDVIFLGQAKTLEGKEEELVERLKDMKRDLSFRSGVSLVVLLLCATAANFAITA